MIADTDLLDAAVIFTTGFAAFRRGPLLHAKARGIGIGDVVRRLSDFEKRYGERFHRNAVLHQCDLIQGRPPTIVC